MRNTLVRSLCVTSDTNATTDCLSSRFSISLAVACVLLSSLALAQPASKRIPDPNGVGAGAGSQTIHLSQAKNQFNLPSQPLEDSLRAIAGQTNSNILFDRSLVRGLTARPLRAELSVQEAIAELLKGTPLTFRNADDKTFLITSKEQKTVLMWPLPNGSY